MTGYGNSKGSFQDQELTVEIRSVNRKNLEFKVIIPRYLLCLEPKIIALAKEYAHRGRLEIYLNLDQGSSQSGTSPFNSSKIRQLYRSLTDLSKELHLGKVTLTDLLSFREFFEIQEEVPQVDSVWPELKPLVETGLINFRKSRFEEGEILRKDFLFRIDLVQKWVAQIETQKDKTLEDFSKKLLLRTQKLIAQISEQPLDPQELKERIALEVVTLVERIDITEELIRVVSHLNNLAAIFQDPHITIGPVGRKADFILQESMREINTIGAKSQCSFISELVVAAKSEIEKMREQVRNIE